MSTELLPPDIRMKYEVKEWRHACSILKTDYPEQWDDIISVLRSFEFTESNIRAPGGGESVLSKFLNGAFRDRGWIEKKFETKIVIDQTELASPTHKVDCVKKGVALEVEWSNKDPFFDRDLNNFRLLFDLRAISVGIIITKHAAREETRDLIAAIADSARRGHLQ